MSESAEGLRLVLSAIGIINILLELVIVGVAFFRFRASLAGLLIGGAYAVIVFVSTLSRVMRWVAPDLMSPVETTGLVLSGAISFAHWILLLVLGVGILLIPSSIDKLASDR